MSGGDECRHRGVNGDEVQGRRDPRNREYEVDIVHTEREKQGEEALIHRQAEDWCIEEIDEYTQRGRGYRARFIQGRAILQCCETTPPHYGNQNQVV